MPAHPRDSASPFYTCGRHKRAFRPLRYRRPTVHRVRVTEAVELPANVVNLAEQTRQRLTFCDVERYLAQLAAHPGDCGCGGCGLVAR